MAVSLTALIRTVAVLRKVAIFSQADTNCVTRRPQWRLTTEKHSLVGRAFHKADTIKCPIDLTPYAATLLCSKETIFRHVLNAQCAYSLN